MCFFECAPFLFSQDLFFNQALHAVSARVEHSRPNQILVIPQPSTSRLNVWFLHENAGTITASQLLKILHPEGDVVPLFS